MTLRRAVPGLVLRHNLHGIDIDLRAVQIAGLALWLRCQRESWSFVLDQEIGLKKDRPPILKSNVVCAEPMPGEKELLDEFLKTLRDDHLEALIRQVMQVPEGTRVRATKAMADSLSDLVRTVWEKMQLAGEAGSLLKIEEELQDAIRRGQEEWEERLPLFRYAEYRLGEEPKEQLLRFVPGEVGGEGATFWDKAESLVRQALDELVSFASAGGRFQRRLFVEDAKQGLGFVDVCRQRFRRGAHESAVRRVEQASAGTPGETVSAHQERPLCGVRGNGPAAPPSGRIAGGDHVPDRLLPVVIPEVAGGSPLARGPADRVRRPGLRGA